MFRISEIRENWNSQGRHGERKLEGGQLFEFGWTEGKNECCENNVSKSRDSKNSVNILENVQSSVIFLKAL